MKKTDEHHPPRAPSRDTSRDPWRVFVPVERIPDTGLHREIEADEATRAAMAEIAGVREIAYVRAAFDLKPRSGGQVHVTGRVQAQVGQNCVVTLEPLANEIDEEVDLVFAPSEQIVVPDEPDDDDDSATDMTDAFEPIENGNIDLGRLASDMLYLAIDPYPRKEGAAFEPQVAASDPADHPFAALKSLQLDAAKPSSKPKRK